jgi:plasmid stability protein
MGMAAPGRASVPYTLQDLDSFPDDPNAPKSGGKSESRSPRFLLPAPERYDRFQYGTIKEPALPTLTIKGLPDPLYRRLKRQAEAHRRSLNGEIIVCLERAVAAGQTDPQAWLAEAAAFRRRVGVRPLTPAQLSRARRAGRA